MAHNLASQKIGLSELLAATLFLAITSPWIWTRGLQNPDELRYASVVVEMIARSDYITPYLNGVPYFEKPPLIYWLGVLSVKTFGNQIGAYRLCSLLSGLGIVLLAGKFGRYYGGARVSFNAGLIAATMAFVFVFSQGFTPDILVAFWITLSMWYLCQLLYEKSGIRNPKTDLFMFYLSCSVAVMSKGFIGIVLPGLVLVAISVHYRSCVPIFKLCRWEGLLIIIVLCLPWHLMLEAQHPGFLDFYVIKEHLFRYTTTIHHRDKAFWYLPAIFILGTFPWSLFTLPALFYSINLKYSPSKREGIPRFLLLWTIMLFGFFWLSKSLLPGYLLPVIPPMSVLLGSYLAEKSNSYTVRTCAILSALCLATALLVYFTLAIPITKTTFLNNIDTVETSSIVFSCALLLVAFSYQGCRAFNVSLTAIAAVPFFLVMGHIVETYEPKSIRTFFLENHTWANDRDVVVYKTYLLDPVFYLQKPVIFVDRISELDYGNRIAPRKELFWSTEKFILEIARGHRFVIIGRENDLEEFGNASCFAKKMGFAICYIN